MIFKVKAAEDRQSVQTLAYVTARTTLQMQNLIPRILFIGGGLSLAVFKGFLSWSGKLASYETFCIVTGITLILLGVFGDRINRWNAWRLTQRSSRETTLLFEDSRFQLEQQGQTTPYSYDSLHAVYQIPGAFVVYLSEKKGYLLRHSDFLEGSPLQFADFLEKRQKKRVEILELKIPGEAAKPN